MALNLVRNSRVFFTTNVDTFGTIITGVGGTTDHTSALTREIQVLDGFTFSQNTEQETVTINEAGATPVRGQRSFNTALAPVDFSMSTYMRPKKLDNEAVKCEESVLWGALTSVTGNGWTEGNDTVDSGSSKADFLNSDAHQLQKFGLIVVLDNVTYLIHNCVLTQATIDFGIDAIATIAWTGQAGSIEKIVNPTIGTGTFTGSLVGAFLPKVTNAPYIANKLSTATFTSAISGSSVPYVVPITGGSLTINNNVTYLTPANLGVVNKPATYFTGTRAITGTLNAYLKTGSATGTDTGGLLSDMLANINSSSPTVEPQAAVLINIGGPNTLKVVLDMPTATFSVPTVDVQQVVSTTINFTAQGASSGNFDIEQKNELTVKYYAPEQSS
jgi:hypothetical protein